VIFVPRVNEEQQGKIATEIGKRLQHTTEKAVFLMPLKGVSRYSSVDRGEIPNPDLDLQYWEQLKEALPARLEVRAMDYNAEDPEFVRHAVEALITLLEG